MKNKEKRAPKKNKAQFKIDGKKRFMSSIKNLYIKEAKHYKKKQIKKINKKKSIIIFNKDINRTLRAINRLIIKYHKIKNTDKIEEKEKIINIISNFNDINCINVKQASIKTIESYIIPQIKKRFERKANESFLELLFVKDITNNKKIKTICHEIEIEWLSKKIRAETTPR